MIKENISPSGTLGSNSGLRWRQELFVSYKTQNVNKIITDSWDTQSYSAFWIWWTFLPLNQYDIFKV